MSSNVTSAGLFYDEGKEPPGYTDPRTLDESAAPELPAKSAPKADWVEHAVQVTGVDPDEAQAMTKPELVETVKAATPAPAPAPAEVPAGA